MATDAAAPRLFVSYSHDSHSHKDWILTLATRLVANGVDVVLDQWDLNLGADLPRFMETGLTESKLVLAVCSGQYVDKANAGKGGVGYEKMILTSQLMQDVTAERILPVIRDNNLVPLLPTFLGARVFVDFRDDAAYEVKYGELLREIHGEKIRPRPALGANPFREKPLETRDPALSNRPERYVVPAHAGTVTFDYSNNDGKFILGSGDMAFETAWSGSGRTSIHTYNDPASIRTVALATGARSFGDVNDASIYDTSSRVRTPQLGEIVVWQNSAGYYALVRIDSLKARGHGDPQDEVIFTYVIQTNRTASFGDA
jgi:hypothetical protein